MAYDEGLFEGSLEEELHKHVVVLGVKLQGLGELRQEQGQLIIPPLFQFLYCE